VVEDEVIGTMELFQLELQIQEVEEVDHVLNQEEVQLVSQVGQD
jgi:hypothetical protein